MEHTAPDLHVNIFEYFSTTGGHAGYFEGNKNNFYRKTIQTKILKFLFLPSLSSNFILLNSIMVSEQHTVTQQHSVQ